nr:uncharacterized protein LOC104644575 [Solanum lycopersicum]
MSEELEEECRAAMPHDNMDLSKLMVHAQQLEESQLKKKNRDAKKARSFESGSSKGMLHSQDNPRFKKMFSNKVPSKFPKARNDRVYNPKSQKGRGVDSPSEKPTCGKCGKKNRGECLVGSDNCFGCGISGHKVRDCPNVRGQEKGNSQAQSSCPTSEVPKRSRFYELKARGEQESSPDVATFLW